VSESVRLPWDSGSHGAAMISGTRVDCSELWNFPRRKVYRYCWRGPVHIFSRRQ
jgi:hypothetical protein